jgi:formylglycine-generating enzyme required for sulfatase activity
VMGSPTTEIDRSDDETQHTVALTYGFYMSKYLVTQGQYAALVGTNPSHFTTADENGNPITPDLNRPVEQVSWNDATNYCGKLTVSERAAGRLPAGWVYRLPMEAEWEYACRAGTSTPFYYGNELRSGMANFYGQYEYPPGPGESLDHYNPNGIYLVRTTAVGSYSPNTFGLYDMVGNVWEWCLDRYGSYPSGSVANPTGPSSGFIRVIRGGSWYDLGRNCRSASRGKYVPSVGNRYLGFRIALAPIF